MFNFKNKRIMVFVPHGDDEVLMCGGTISKLVESGNDVICVFSNAAKDDRTIQQHKDIIKVKDFLGYNDVILMDLSEEILSNDKVQFMRKFEEINKKIKPDVVYTTFYGDNHQDHKTVFEATSMACRTWGPHHPNTIFCGEIPSSTDQSPNIIQFQFMPNYYNILTDEQIEKKKQALLIYSTEICPFPHPRSLDGIELFARKRGNECKTKYAEAFVCIKHIES
jgi:LmbE family N-acetylglucosaminyl deacetylase